MRKSITKHPLVLSGLAAFFLSLGAFSLLLGKPFHKLIGGIFIVQDFQCQHNYCSAVHPFFRPLHIFGLATVLFMLLCLVFLRIKPKPLFHAALLFLISLNIFSASVQAYFLLSNELQDDLISFSTTYEEKKEGMFKKIYLFAKQVRRRFPGYHNATLVSDLDLTEGRDLTFFRLLAYLLCPVNILGHPTGAEIELYIIIDKPNAPELIPKGYSLTYQFNNNNIVALKDSSP